MKVRKAHGTLERRDVTAARPDITDEGKIRGLAIPFEQWTTIGSGKLSFREKVATGAVTKTFQEGDVVLLDNHDPARPIARKSADTLEMRVGPEGARYEAIPADTTYARDAVTNIRAKNYGGMSFGFEVVKEKWDIGTDGIDERTLLEIKAPEISICTFPAYDGTEVGMRDAYSAGIEARDRYYETRAGDAPGDGKKPYGNVTYADPGYQSDKKKRYPIDTKDHVKAAWSYINKAKNAGRYTASQLAAIKAKIKSAAKKFGITIGSDRSFADFDLRGYDPVTGIEKRDDPDGKEYAAMNAAIMHLDEGDADAARTALEMCLESYDDSAEEGEFKKEDSNGQVAHTTQAGSVVPVRANGEIAVAVSPRVLQRAYDLVRELTPTPQSNEALSILEPLLEAPTVPAADEGERAEPKPERPSTSAVTRDSDVGRELERRFEALQHKHRP